MVLLMVKVAGAQFTSAPAAVPLALTCTVWAGVVAVNGPEVVTVAELDADESVPPLKVAATPGAPGVTEPMLTVVVGYPEM